MKNITVSVPEDLYTQARIKAAERKTSVTALVRAYLQDLVAEESEFERLLRLHNEVIESIEDGFSAKNRFSREQVHDRDAFR